MKIGQVIPNAANFCLIKISILYNGKNINFNYKKTNQNCYDTIALTNINKIQHKQLITQLIRVGLRIHDLTKQ